MNRICGHIYYRYLLGDTHCVLALTDECLSVILSLWSDCDKLKCVWSGTELSVGWFHFCTGAVSQVNSSNRILAGEKINK